MRNSKGKETVAMGRRRHLKVRAWQRYHLQLNWHDIQLIVNKIQSGNSICILKESNSRTHHEVELNGSLLYLVYHTRRKEILTVLKTPRRKKRKQIDDLSPEEKRKVVGRITCQVGCVRIEKTGKYVGVYQIFNKHSHMLVQFNSKTLEVVDYFEPDNSENQ